MLNPALITTLTSEPRHQQNLTCSFTSRSKAADFQGHTTNKQTSPRLHTAASIIIIVLIMELHMVHLVEFILKVTDFTRLRLKINMASRGHNPVHHKGVAYYILHHRPVLTFDFRYNN